MVNKIKKLLILKSLLMFLPILLVFILFYLNYFSIINSLLLISILLLNYIYIYVLKYQNKIEILDHTGYGIIKVSLGKGIVFANNYALNTLGYEYEDLHSSHYHESVEKIIKEDKDYELKKVYFSKDNRSRNKIFNYYQNKYQCSSFIDKDYFIRKDGSELAVEYTIMPIFKKNIVTSIVITFRDITERRIMQENLLKITEELKSSNKELESFSYSVSHDLRAPLRHISGFINLIQENEKIKSDEETGRYLNIILKSTKKMGELIDDLLVFSRVSRSELQITKVDLNEIVSDLKDELCTFSETERTIIWNIDQLPSVMADKKMLRLLLMNLMSNAIKFTKFKSEAKISILSEVSENEVIIKVIDNGVGFEQKYVDKIFGVFQRLHSDSEFEGTGIGLANVFRIISRHNGRVWAMSTPNEGSSFFISLPRKEV